MQKLQKSTKEPNLENEGTDEGESDDSGTDQIFRRIMEEKSHLRKTIPIQIQETHRTENRNRKKKQSHEIFYLRQNKQVLPKAARTKQRSCKGKCIRELTSQWRLKAKILESNKVKVLKLFKSPTKLFYKAKLSGVLEGVIKYFS